VFRSIGVKPSLSASSRIITGSTFPRRTAALSTEQMIAIAVPDTSKVVSHIYLHITIVSSNVLLKINKFKYKCAIFSAPFALIVTSGALQD